MSKEAGVFDEGTAGEAVAWQWRHGDDMDWHTSGVRHDWFDDEVLNPRFRLRPLYASDIYDKLRRAIRALEAVVSDCNLAASACDSEGPAKGFLHVANDARQALAALEFLAKED